VIKLGLKDIIHHYIWEEDDEEKLKQVLQELGWEFRGEEVDDYGNSYLVFKKDRKLLVISDSGDFMIERDENYK